MKMVAYITFVILNFLVHVNGDCDTFLYDIINCYGLYDVHPVNPPDSIITLCDQYYPMCADKESFMSCYYTAISTCEEDKRLYNPLVFDTFTAKAVLYGCCQAQEAFNRGKDCVGSQYEDIHAIISNICFVNAVITQVSADAVISGNWTDLCTAVDDSYNCISDLLRPLNCTERYTTAYSKLMYAAVPPYCINGSAVFQWIDIYGLNKCPTFSHFSGIVTVVPMLLFIHYELFMVN